MCDIEAQRIERLQQVLDVVDMCERRSQPGARDPLTLKVSKVAPIR